MKKTPWRCFPSWRSRSLRIGRWFYGLLTLALALGIAWGQPSSAQPSATNWNAAPLLLAQVDLPVLPAAEPKAKSENLKTIPSGQPVKVSVGLHISNLADVNQASETFDINGYLMYTWQDKRLAYRVKPGEPASKASALDQIWHPAIEMVNFKASNNSETLVDIQPDGTVAAQERFAKTLSAGLSLQRFPFDRQSLQVVLESLRYPEKEVQFVADPKKISIGTDNFVSLSEWQIGEIKGINGKSFFPPESQHYSRVTIDINIKRNSGFYILKVMLPLLFITIASWSVFWINPNEFSTQIGIAFTNLLTVVALLLVINDSLPKVGYVTFMDGFTMTCFMTILVAILVLLIAHRSKSRDNDQRAQKVQNLARWVVPSGFVLTNLILLASMHLL
jgi:Neurotransmitter-gated ion-channel ligand binding domain/Neurotransmitter-gated ion-channel transmembrane region